MRILALKPPGYVIPSIHASLMKSFHSLGQEVVEIPFPAGKGDLGRLKSFDPDWPGAIFSLDLPLNPILRNRLREYQEFLGIPLIIWFVDDPDGYDFPDHCDPARTLVFCWDLEITDHISRRGRWKGIPPVHLPLATDPELFYPEKSGFLRFPGGVFVGSTAHPNPVLDGAIRNSPGFEAVVRVLWEKWKKDLGRPPQELTWGFLRKKTGIEAENLQENLLARLWVHSAVYALGRLKRKEIVSRVIGEGGGVFGDRGWEQTVGNMYRGEVAYGADLRRIYGDSSWVLDIRQPQSRSGLTQRIFDAGACARPVLADYSPEIESLFDVGKEAMIFHTVEEAQEIKKRLHDNPRAGIHMGNRAREKILALHTYRHRAGRIMDVFQRYFPASLA